MSEDSSGSFSEQQDPRVASRRAAERLIEEFPELFSEAFDANVPEGWYEIARQCCDGIVRIDPAARVYQLKEKFGGIRMYMNAVSPPVHTMTDALEHQSFHTCQECGNQPASPHSTNNYWVKTLCDGCAE